jgi:acetyl-CoA carboxylase biotin carboxyl carrier protein
VTLTPDDVADILRVLDSTPYDELHLETSRFSLSLRRDGDGWTQEARSLDTPNILDTPAPVVVEEPAAPAPVAEPAREGLIEVTTPILGTFYRSPKPGAPPFVEVGSPVGPETVVGIVETMKMMNSVYAGGHGTVAEICRADAEFAEAGSVLLRIAAPAS